MRILFNFLLNPVSWIIAAMLWYALRHHRWTPAFKRRFWAIGLAGIYLCSTPWIPGFFISRLEGRHPVLQTSRLSLQKKYHIMILGGGMGYDKRLPATSLLEPVLLTRLTEGLRVWHAAPQSILITSGKSRSGLPPQALVAREAAGLLGFDTSRVFTFPLSVNTRMESDEYVAKFGKDTSLVLVTSAIHMPRAMQIFQQNGIKEVIPAPTHYLVKKDNPFAVNQLLPNPVFWGHIQAALHEAVGLLIAR